MVSMKIIPSSISKVKGTLFAFCIITLKKVRLGQIIIKISPSFTWCKLYRLYGKYKDKPIVYMVSMKIIPSSISKVKGTLFAFCIITLKKVRLGQIIIKISPSFTWCKLYRLYGKYKDNPIVYMVGMKIIPSSISKVKGTLFAFCITNSFSYIPNQLEISLIHLVLSLN